MKKKEKIMIGIILLILIIMVGILVFSKTYANKIGKGNVEDKNSMEAYPLQIKAISYQSLDEYKEYDKITTLRSRTASTEILVRFNGILYGKAFAVIDYMGGSENIGTIDKLIDTTYVPKFDGETNCKDILGADVFECSEKNVVLNYNNQYVLFEAI